MSIAEKLTTIAENEQKVYDKGGSDTLKKVWDSIQSNGQRNTAGHYNYSNAFNYQDWNEETFRPNYDIVLKADTRGLFTYCNFAGSLKKALDNAGVKLDTSKCVNFYTIFYSMIGLTELPQLDLRKATGSLVNMIHYCPQLKRIDGVICSEDTNFASSTFGTQGVGAIEDCIFSGVIGKSLKISQLTGLNHESLMSVINCLKDFGLVYYNDNPTWTKGAFGGYIVQGYKITINAEIIEGKEYTVRIKDNAYGDDEYECRDFDFLCDVSKQVGMTYTNGYLTVTFTAKETLNGEFEAGVITDSSTADLGSIEIRQTPTTTKTLTLGTTLQAKLTEAEIAIATEKGWTVA